MVCLRPDTPTGILLRVAYGRVGTLALEMFHSNSDGVLVLLSGTLGSPRPPLSCWEEDIELQWRRLSALFAGTPLLPLVSICIHLCAEMVMALNPGPSTEKIPAKRFPGNRGLRSFTSSTTGNELPELICISFWILSL